MSNTMNICTECENTVLHLQHSVPVKTLDETDCVFTTEHTTFKHICS